MDEPRLINLALAGLANPKHGITGFKNSKVSNVHRRSLQTDLVTAQKFTIDDTLVKHCVAASLDNPTVLAQMATQAIPPFDLMWIEWNDLLRVQELSGAYAKLNGNDASYADFSETSNRVGYLIKRVNGRFLYTMACTIEDQVGFAHNGFYFSNEDEITHAETQYGDMFNGIHEDPQSFLEQQRDGMFMLMGSEWWKAWMAKGGIKTAHADWFARRFQMAQTFGGLTLTDEEWRLGWNRNEMADLARRNARMMDGDLRFLICALGFLNYEHVIYETDRPDPKTKHIRHGRRVPQNETRLVSVDLPKRCVVARRGILTGTGTPKRQHWRRGHWRIYKDKSGHVAKRVWIEPQLVGNPENGYIDHDYELRGKKYG